MKACVSDSSGKVVTVHCASSGAMVLRSSKLQRHPARSIKPNCFKIMFLIYLASRSFEHTFVSEAGLSYLSCALDIKTIHSEGTVY